MADECARVGSAHDTSDFRQVDHREVRPRTGHGVRLELASAIREARRDAGISVRQLASAASVGPRTVAELESAARDPGIEVLARIACALGGRLRLWMEPGTGVVIHDRHRERCQVPR